MHRRPIEICDTHWNLWHPLEIWELRGSREYPASLECSESGVFLPPVSGVESIKLLLSSEFSQNFPRILSRILSEIFYPIAIWDLRNCFWGRGSRKYPRLSWTFEGGCFPSEKENMGIQEKLSVENAFEDEGVGKSLESLERSKEGVFPPQKETPASVRPRKYVKKSRPL